MSRVYRSILLLLYVYIAAAKDRLLQHRRTAKSENFVEKHILRADCVSEKKNAVKK